MSYQVSLGSTFTREVAFPGVAAVTFLVAVSGCESALPDASQGLESSSATAAATAGSGTSSVTPERSVSVASSAVSIPSASGVAPSPPQTAAAASSASGSATGMISETDGGAGPAATASSSGPDPLPTSDSGATDGGATGADAGMSPDPDPCAGGTTYEASTTANTRVTEYGWVSLHVPTNNQIVAFDTTMIVPDPPPATGTLFLWPGLQPYPGAANYDVLDNGVLQPVLTFGPTCAPDSPDQSYESWWISGQYVNTFLSTSSPNYPDYGDCHGGPGMSVAVGDTLDLRFALEGTDWIQTVTNRRNAESVSYTIDMLGQAQGIAEFVIEEYDSTPVSDVPFLSSVITFASPAKSSCQPIQRGANDYFSAPRVSADGLRCCIDKIILRAEGVEATSPDAP